ncbi:MULTISPECIES: ABC transporter ATP-binding protein [unclassified Enterococcus]|uniref:ABC transporter ATP-binding protein n=1 Tax=unclassified Enterococcus TaxID=2608891 RepID=UPI0015555BE1|nr:MULTISPECIES: ABC transporter ATP-binding protein [unclassified Enterococcus]MBS7577543.1 ABC transporter ATP-binding protein [Enterococcus sp. MMGLQ5-2]MBS7584958.1 ABC transporter ATP-binding protein [Enterococcus sp. MMGLQ5-1]NPD12813.1 ABC transporter ATP-binding protein [Enterococcus sp. MMGLQ5-1]NPD37376.1 ABC transporter ATP-binding protein [Enterococcus sp. MMGLQ5-2]
MKELIGNINIVLLNQKKRLIQPLVLSILDGILTMFYYAVMIVAIVQLVKGQFTSRFFISASLILVIVFFLRILISGITYNSMQLRGSEIITKLRIQLAEHVRELNLGYFNKNSIGKLASHFTTDISDFEQLLTHYFNDFIKGLFMITLGVISAVIIDFRFSILILVMIALAIPVLTKGGHTSSNISKQHQVKINEVVSRVVEYINGIRTFRLYKLTGTKFIRLNQSFNDLRKSSIKVELSIGPYVVIFQTIVSMILPLALVWGTYLLIEGQVTTERFIAVLMLSISISSQLVAVGGIYAEMKFFAKSVNNIKNVLGEKPLSYETQQFIGENHQIQFNQVSFAYEADVPVIKDLNLTIAEGETCALIGPSGSGKSTLIALVSRFWDVTEGQITIGNQAINHLKPDAITEQISCVFQDVYLFNDTIINNIRLAKPEATIEEVEAVCRIARCHDFISQLENGYETIVGEGGSTLSGGEKQRISIARALLKDAPIVLLDETTSSLDVDNEKEINEAMDYLMRDKTVIVIAHRLNTIINADQIVVLDQGQLREKGNHRTLLENDDWYAQMYREQEKARNWTVKA